MAFGKLARSMTPSGLHRRTAYDEDAHRHRSNSLHSSSHTRPLEAVLAPLDAVAMPPVVADRRPVKTLAPPKTTPRSVAFFEEPEVESAASYESPDLRSTSYDSGTSYETDATSVNTLPALQAKIAYEYGESLEPVIEDDPGSYNLVNPPQGEEGELYSLESRSEQIFSPDHLRAIFKDPKLLIRFTTFLGQQRPQSVPLLIYYLDALKAIAAVTYSNAVAEALEPLDTHEFSKVAVPATRNERLEERARKAFDVLARDDLPAFVTHIWVNVVSTSIRRRIMGTMPPQLREASEGLAEVFCLTDPSRHDNPIVFASDEFHRTTQYGVNYVIGRNCRFLQGPRTNRDSVRRLQEACTAGKELCETFLNYRRDGSPFMNLLMVAPLRDSRGTLRYYIGAQVDVSGLARECTELEGVQTLIEENEGEPHSGEKKDEFQELSEMFNQAELEIVRKHGGAMHSPQAEEDAEASKSWHRPRVLLQDSSSDDGTREHDQSVDRNPQYRIHGKLSGVYTNYLLVRPYPSLRILFASPSLRVPGILQSPFMNRIGSSERVREELVAAFSEGRGVTAKIKWISKHDEEGRNRWVHCTPLYGSSGAIGVYMVVLVDDDASRSVRRFREAPPIAPPGHTVTSQQGGNMSRSRSRETSRSSYEDSVRIEDPAEHAVITTGYGRISTKGNGDDSGTKLIDPSERDYGSRTPSRQKEDYGGAASTARGSLRSRDFEHRPKPPMPTAGRVEFRTRPASRSEEYKRSAFGEVGTQK